MYIAYSARVCYDNDKLLDAMNASVLFPIDDISRSASIHLAAVSYTHLTLPTIYSV